MHKVYSNLKGFSYLSVNGNGCCDINFNPENLLLKTGKGFRDILIYNYDHSENSDMLFHIPWKFDCLWIVDAMGDADE